MKIELKRLLTWKGVNPGGGITVGPRDGCVRMRVRGLQDGQFVDIDLQPHEVQWLRDQLTRALFAPTTPMLAEN